MAGKTNTPTDYPMMQWFQTKPTRIRAVQITDTTFDDPHPNPEHIPGVRYNPADRTASIVTLEGTMTAQVGDWIVCGVKGELYPVNHDIFFQLHTEAERTPR